ncbi:MAG: hypothetical protein ACE5GM_01350 [bacterium]
MSFAQFDTDARLRLMMRMFTQGNILEGEKLFKDTGLGGNGKSCAGCHGPDKRYQLGKHVVSLQMAAWIQYCYQKYQKGKSVLEEKKLYDLFAYVKFLQR